jgi:hypothetical protein
MTDMIVNVMVEVLSVLAIVTKEIKQGIASEWIPVVRNSFVAYSFSAKFMKKLAGKSGTQKALSRLDKLMQEEVPMAVAQNLRGTHRILDGAQIVFR